MQAGLRVWMIAVALLAGLAVAALLYYKNKKQHYGTFLTALLFALRTLSVGTVVMLLFNPFIRQTSNTVEQPVVLLAQDNSASLVLGRDSAFFKTQYFERFSSFHNALQSDFQVEPYLFGQDVHDFDSLNFSEQATDVSNLLNTLNRRYYKRNVGAVLLFSDGISNRGYDAKLLAEDFPYPIYTVILGDTVAYPDLSVKQVHVNRTVSLGATYPLRATVLAQDLAGKKATLKVSVEGKQVDKQEFEIPSNRFSKEFDFMLDADTKGVKQIDIVLTGVEGEEHLQNNAKRVFVEVLDQKFKVLCIAKSPHPDLAALRSVLNDNCEMDFHFDGDVIPDFSKYDLLLLHQTPSASTDFDALYKQLGQNKKMPVLFVVGPGTQLELLNKLQHAYQIRQGASQTILDVKAYGNASFSTFTIEGKTVENVSKMPPLALPHSEITPLSSHDDMLLQDVLGVKSGVPVMSFAQDGRKIAFLFGTNIWRWRLFEFHQSGNHDGFDEVFSKTLKYLLLAADEGCSVFAKESYYVNEPVVIRAELRNPSDELVTEPEMKAQFVNKLTKETYDYVFTRRDHDYELNAGILPEGLYIYKVQTRLGEKDIVVNGSFSIVSLGIEAQQLTSDVDLMRALALLTNGKCYAFDEREQLLTDLKQDQRITSVAHHETRFKDLIHAKWIFFLLLGMLTLEWVLRKMFGSY